MIKYKMLIKYTRENYIFLLLLTVLSSIFRVFFQDNIQFASDQSLSFWTVYSLITNHQFPLTGMISSTGFYNFPFFVYFMSLLSFIYTEIRFLSLEIAILNVIAVVGFYYLAKNFYSRFVAITSSLLLSLAPLPILFSRIIWQQDVILIFLIPFLYFLHRLVYLRDSKASFAVFILGTLLMQVHTSCIFFIVISVIYVYSQKVYIKKIHAIFGFLLGLIPAIPYFKYQFFSGTFCMDCVRFAQTRSHSFSLDIFNFLRPLELFTTFTFNFQLGKSYQEFIDSSFLLIPIQIIVSFCILLVIVGIYFALKKNKKYRLLVAYVVFLPILYFLTGNVAYMHYYVVVIPIIALLAGIGFEYLIQITKAQKIQFLLYALFGLVLISYIIFEILFNSFLSTKKVVQGDYARIWEVGENIITSRLDRYSHEPYYYELKYYSSTYIYSYLFHIIVGDYLLTKNNISGAIYEYSQQLLITPKDDQLRQKLEGLKRSLDKSKLK